MSPRPKQISRPVILTPRALELISELGSTTRRAVTNGDLARALELGLHILVSSEQARLKEQLLALPTDPGIPTAPTYRRLAVVDAEELALMHDWMDY